MRVEVAASWAVRPNEPSGFRGHKAILNRFLKLFFFFFFSFVFSSPSYSSVPVVHLITAVYTTVVRTTECVCVMEAGGVTAALTH